MSEDWGADAIPLRAAGPLNLVEALSVARHMPAEAIAAAARRPGAIADAVIAVVERAASGEELVQREQNLLFWGLHALAEARETRLFAPLLRLLRLPSDALEALLGDVLTATLPRVATSLFDGDTTALTAAISDPAIDEFARWSLLGALTVLTHQGKVDRADTVRFLVRFDEERLARAGDAAWTGWRDAIGLLGLAELSDRVIAARADARLLEDADESEALAAHLADALARPQDGSRLEAAGLGDMDDTVARLDQMLSAYEQEEGPAEEPVHNPLRHVGRNDPCPCGSGRKFKKCCLTTSQPSAA